MKIVKVAIYSVALTLASLSFAKSAGTGYAKPHATQFDLANDDVNAIVGAVGSAIGSSIGGIGSSVGSAVGSAVVSSILVKPASFQGMTDKNFDL